VTIVLETEYQKFIYYRSYSRWIPDLKRRETWNESVKRYGDFMLGRVPDEYEMQFKEALGAIEEGEVMPSMRALWTAGKALEREHVAAYNCCYEPIAHPKAFAEILYILMNGTGVGFSVEQDYIKQLPEVPAKLTSKKEKILVRDSKRGWAEALYKYIRKLYAGEILEFDVSRVRPKGAILKTFGGRASGPDPLLTLWEYTRRTFEKAKGRRLHPIEAYDIACVVMDCVVSGGVRRSAGISLSDLWDRQMAKAKSGSWFDAYPHRARTNNSVIYDGKPDARTFISEWLKLIESRSGERGIWNREGANYSIAAGGRRDPDHAWGCNPCGEIILRPYEFCNLTEVVVRPEDNLKDLERKVRHAAILGVVQSTLTDFNLINAKFKRNCEEERLLGVSLTGLADHPTLGNVSKSSRKWLLNLKEEVNDTAEEWASHLGINVPAATTCVKPSGTVSQLNGVSSGISPRYAEHYIRRVRVSAFDPLARLLVDSGMEAKPESGEEEGKASTLVFEFPEKSPDTAVCMADRPALDQLKYWGMLKKYWCEHNPSATIYCKDSEWPDVGAWVYDNWNMVCGLTFFPSEDNVYKLAPYEEIDEETYRRMADSMPHIDYTKLSEYEAEDNTEGSQELACAGGACEL
jgi:ribonucleoside-diphosphate reductase alpha chain